jgi:hypothetical protein
MNCKATEASYILIMISIEAKLNCEWHIADLQIRIAQLKERSGLGCDAALASAEFVELLQQTLNSWEERKKTLAEHH